MKIKTTTILISLSLLSFSANATTEDENNNLLWMSLNNSFYDYLNNSNSELKSQGSSIGFSHQFTPQLLASISISKENAEDQWINEDIIFDEFFTRAETSSNSSGISVSWLAEEHTLTFSYSNLRNDEYATRFFPREKETKTINGKDKLVSFSYNNFATFNEWSLGWGLGIQYAKNDTSSRTIRTNDIITLTNSHLEQNNWSGYVDIDISYFESHYFE